MLEVLEPGLLTTLQDLGRPGYSALGIGRAGAADVPALRLANALVGNDEGACAIEMTLHGPKLIVHCNALMALTGALLPQARCNDRAWPMWRPVRVQAGSTIKCGGMPLGCRAYLAISGGIDVQAWLGSRSTDVNAALGHDPLQTGDRLPLRATSALDFSGPPWWLDPAPWFNDSQAAHLRIMPSRHTNDLNTDSLQALGTAEFKVLSDSNRAGIRLSGPSLTLKTSPSVISEGTVPGTMQLPPNGQPIVLGCEHPVTGGYPRIGQVAEVDLPRLAQLRAGDSVGFQWITLAQARAGRAEQQTILSKLLTDIGERLGQGAR